MIGKPRDNRGLSVTLLAEWESPSPPTASYSAIFFSKKFVVCFIMQNISHKFLSEVVSNYLSNNKDYQVALKLVKENSEKGKIWLVGGQVFRPLLKALYNVDFENQFDFDFIVKNLKDSDNFKISKGWNLTKTGLGEPRLINGDKQIDIISLDHSVSPYQKLDLSKMNATEKLTSYFNKVPLNIQGIAFDIDKNMLVGNIGIQGVIERKISVNCLKECLAFCRRRKISIRRFIEKKIEGEIFTRDYPDFNDSKKSSTKSYYEKNFSKYVSRNNFKDFAQKYSSKEFDLFYKLLGGKDILDIGAGNGRDSILFKKLGYEPLAIDISTEMVKLCRNNEINAIVSDIENCEIPENTFDGAYAYCSLLHIPKERIFNSLARVSELLKHNGVFFICMIKGKNEAFFDGRFFSYYQESELKDILTEYFEIELIRTFKVGRMEYINAVCKKRIN